MNHMEELKQLAEQRTRETSVPLADERVAFYARQYLAKKDDLVLSKWANKHRILNANQSSLTGRWRTELVPPLAMPMDAYDDKRFSEIGFMSCIQIGKTELLLNAILKEVCERPGGRALYIAPSRNIANEFGGGKLRSAIQDCAKAKALITDDGVVMYRGQSKKVSDSIGTKHFINGSSIVTVSAQEIGGTDMRSASLLLLDEVDLFKSRAVIQKAQDRLTAFKRRGAKTIIACSPTEKGKSIIYDYYNSAGEQWEYHHKCLDCNELHLPEWSNVIYDKDSNGAAIAESARYTCPRCGTVCLTDLQRMEQVQHGRYVLKAEGRYKQRIAFNVGQLSSPFVTLKDMVNGWQQAQDDLKLNGDTDTLNAFTNRRLGKVYDIGKNNFLEINTAHYVNYNPLESHPKIDYQTLCVDVQGDRLEWERAGWNLETRQRFGIERGNFIGNPTIEGSGEFPKVWYNLAKYMVKKVGGQVPLMVGIDRGYLATTVLTFVSYFSKSSIIYTIQGVGTPSRTGHFINVNKLQTPMIGGVMGHQLQVYTNEIKDFIKSQISIEGESMSQWLYPKQMYIKELNAQTDFGYNRRYQDEMGAEFRQQARTTVSNPSPRWVWAKRVSSRPNESLDLGVYSVALSYKNHQSPMKGYDKRDMDATKKRISKELEVCEAARKETVGLLAKMMK